MICIKHNYLKDDCVQYFVLILDDYLHNMHLSCLLHVFLFVYALILLFKFCDRR